MALLAAPPGFGKTSLLSEWVVQSQAQIAWVSLDAGDNDPVRFWDYVVAAVRTLQPGLGEETLALLHEPQPLPMEAILATLINQLAGVAGPLGLVLDDYHLIEAEPIQKALAYWLEHLPPQLRLILATRADPPLPLARLRARGQLLELRAADLRFSAQEIPILLQRMAGVELAAEAIVHLEARTEGWVAGLQLAALALQGRDDSAGFIQEFAGDHRYLLDYLGDEVLDRQPVHVQSFLLHTAILDRLSAGLCAALVTDWGHGTDTWGDAAAGFVVPNAHSVASAQSILVHLEQTNLFVVSLDERRQWYRYHHLFADFLRHRLHQLDPERAMALHRRASAWFQQNGFLLEAVDHALAAGDFAQAAALIEEAGELLIWRRAELHTLQRWLALLPEHVLVARPKLCLYHAWALYLTGRQAAAEQRVQEAEEALIQGIAAGDPLGTGMAATLRSTLAGIRQHFSQASAFSRQALQLLPEGAISWRCVAAINLGVSCAAIGTVDEATATLSHAMELSQEIGSAFAMLSAFWHLAALQVAQLRLDEAETTCRQLRHLAAGPGQQPFPIDGYIALLRGEIYLERNQLKPALQHLEESAQQINPEGFPIALLRSYVALARVKQAQGNADRAHEFLQRAEQIELEHNLQARASPLSVRRAQIWIEQGNLTAASRWVEESRLGVDDEFAYHREAAYLVLARLLMAQARIDPAGGHLETALRLLERMALHAEQTGHTGSLVRALALQALALNLRGENRQALETLARALSLAEPAGAVRTFVDEGPSMAALLLQILTTRRRGRPALAWPVAPDYVERLLSALGGSPASLPAEKPAALRLVEPLSERELEVLRLLAEDLTSNEIAQRLVIAVGTARRHIKNIYGKLDAHSRLEAIRRGQELGLL